MSKVILFHTENQRCGQWHYAWQKLEMLGILLKKTTPRNARSLKLPIETKGEARKETLENVLPVTLGLELNPQVRAETVS